MAPRETRDWHELISKPKYKIRTEKDVRVPMRDGVHLSVDVFRPDADGMFPALLVMSPYWNEGQYLPIPRGFAHPDSGWGNYALEAGDSNQVVPRGYAHVVANVRGSGLSEGEYPMMGPTEARDGYDLIEWIAKQRWCDGNVGMMGISYFSWIQYTVAAQNPPHLRAIAPIDGAGDLYRDVFYQGGVLAIGFTRVWNSELAENNNVILSEKEFSTEELKRRVEEVKAKNDDIKYVFNLYNVLIAPKKNPVAFDLLLHPTDGPFYWEKSGYSYYHQISVPTMCGARLDGYDLHLPGGFSSWEGIKSTKKKFFIYQRVHERPFHEHHDILMRWFDHWLKGNDTGMMDEPPISLWVQGKDQWRFENEWPLARTEWTKFYLRSNGLVSTEQARGDEPTDSFPNLPYITLMDAAKPLPTARYATQPMSEDLEITGPMALYLYASLDNSDCNWVAEIYDVSPDGQKRLVTRGWLKASFREIDAARSKPYRPWHQFSRQVPVEAGKVELYAIDLHDNCNVFLKGHKLELDVKGGDHSLEGGWAYIFNHLQCSKKVTQTIHHDASFPSHLLLPVIAKSPDR